MTEEWSDLEPDVLERKYYVSGIGMISSEIIKGGDEHFDLTTFEQGAGTPEATPGIESGNRDLCGGRGESSRPHYVLRLAPKRNSEKTEYQG